jgi:hypothetical protein
MRTRLHHSDDARSVIADEELKRRRRRGRGWFIAGLVCVMLFSLFWFVWTAGPVIIGDYASADRCHEVIRWKSSQVALARCAAALKESLPEGVTANPRVVGSGSSRVVEYEFVSEVEVFPGVAIPWHVHRRIPFPP